MNWSHGRRQLFMSKPNPQIIYQIWSRIQENCKEDETKEIIKHFGEISDVIVFRQANGKLSHLLLNFRLGWNSWIFLKKRKPHQKNPTKHSPTKQQNKKQSKKMDSNMSSHESYERKVFLVSHALQQLNNLWILIWTLSCLFLNCGVENWTQFLKHILIFVG